MVGPLKRLPVYNFILILPVDNPWPYLLYYSVLTLHHSETPFWYNVAQACLVNRHRYRVTCLLNSLRYIGLLSRARRKDFYFVGTAQAKRIQLMLMLNTPPSTLTNYKPQVPMPQCILFNTTFLYIIIPSLYQLLCWLRLKTISFHFFPYFLYYSIKDY